MPPASLLRCHPGFCCSWGLMVCVLLVWPASSSVIASTENTVRQEEHRETHTPTVNIPTKHAPDSGFIQNGSLQYNAVLDPFSPSESHKYLLPAWDAYVAALDAANQLGDARAQSYAWGHLAHLYEQAGQYEEALLLTRQARVYAEMAGSPESLFRWHWQTGRILVALHDPRRALHAYDRAKSILQLIHNEYKVGYKAQQDYFREFVRQMYTELADLQLQQAGSMKDQHPENVQTLLRQARDTVEQLKTVELVDYFGNECVERALRQLHEIDENIDDATAIVYPIVFADRLELLVTLPTGIRQYTVSIAKADLTREVRTFRKKLETTARPENGQASGHAGTTLQEFPEYLNEAKSLYKSIIRPMEQDLTQLKIHTLVFVPGGWLRTIPLAALHDGKNFVVAKYAIAVTPGLQVTDPHPISSTNIHVLAMGLSERARGIPPLQYVDPELQAAVKLGGTELLNDQFRLSSVSQRMKENRFNVLHFATHGSMESEVRRSYILAFDGKMTMDDLEDLIGLYNFRETPLDLLILSACQTAADDDQAALGLAGVAVKAGARSALATLWSIDDRATNRLMEEFYEHLPDPGVSKAMALQRAQLKLLDHPQTRHPFFWAPFLLIGDWL